MRREISTSRDRRLIVAFGQSPASLLVFARPRGGEARYQLRFGLVGEVLIEGGHCAFELSEAPDDGGDTPSPCEEEVMDGAREGDKSLNLPFDRPL